MALPERPYEVVECDHTYVDILLVHPTAKIILGRPVLTTFVCRATRMIVGYAIGYEVPSYTAFLQGLRNTIYPKDMSAFPKVKKPWNAYGMIENLVVDNGKEFIGTNIEQAAHLLGMNVIHARPREPHLKGFVERMFGVMNVQLTHSLPGTTLSNVVVRKKHEAIDPPVLVLDDFEALLVQWIVTRNHMPTRGLDARVRDPSIPSASNVPADEWNRLATLHPCGELLKPEYFEIVAGDKTQRQVNTEGISWDNIWYSSDELAFLRSRSDGTTRPGINRGKFLCSRDPYDLGKIHVYDPQSRKWLSVPAAEDYPEYTEGLSLHVHRLVCARANEKKKARLNLRDLLKAKAALVAESDKTLSNPKNKKVQRNIARFVESNAKARHRSRIRTSMPTNTNDLMSAFEEMESVEAATDAPVLDVTVIGVTDARKPTPKPTTSNATVASVGTRRKKNPAKAKADPVKPAPTTPVPTKPEPATTGKPVAEKLKRLSKGW